MRHIAILKQNCPMPLDRNSAKIYQGECSNRRKARLRQLIADEYGNDRPAFIKQTGINTGELSLLLKNGGKLLGEKRAANLAIAAGKPPDYFDDREDPIKELPNKHPTLPKTDNNAAAYEERRQPITDVKARTTSEQQERAKMDATIPQQPEDAKIQLPAEAEELKKNMLGLEAVLEIFGFTKATLYRAMKEKDFPKPFMIGGQNRWWLPTLLAYIKTKASAANGGRPSCT